MVAINVDKPKPKDHRNLSEKLVTQNVRSFLNTMRMFHWKQWQGPMSQPKGASDIIGIKKAKVADLVARGVEEVGIFVAIELKDAGGKPDMDKIRAKRPIPKSDLHLIRQDDFLQTVRENGGIGFFADCVEDLIREIGFEGVRLF